MELFTQLLLFIFYGGLIILVTKFLMIHYIRKLAEAKHLSTDTIGKILGYSTSMPELISGVAAASVGMIDTCVYNVLFSNIINILLFTSAAIWYKKEKTLFGNVFLDEITLVIITLIIPASLIGFHIETSPILIPIFAILYLLYLNVDRFLPSNEYRRIKQELKKTQQEETKDVLKSRRQKIFYAFMILVSIGILYILGNRLSIILETLFSQYAVPQFVLGLAIGIMTSLPELTSFFESFRFHKDDTQLHSIDVGTVEALNNLTSSNVSNILLVQTVSLSAFYLFQLFT